MPTSSQAHEIVEILTSRNQTLSIAESLTGGGLGAALTEIPGSSKVFLGGIISYTTQVKVRELNVSQSTIDTFSVVSEKVAIEMANGARKKFEVRGLSPHGVAGPGDYQGIREGTVWIAIQGPINESIHLTLGSGRDGVRTGAISSAIATFARILKA